MDMGGINQSKDSLNAADPLDGGIVPHGCKVGMEKYTSHFSVLFLRVHIADSCSDSTSMSGCPEDRGLEWAKAELEGMSASQWPEHAEKLGIT